MSDASATWTSPLLDLLFEEPSVGRCLVAPDGSILRANAEWLRTTGFSLDDVLGASIIDLFPETRDMSLALHARARAGHVIEVPRHAQKVSGHERWWDGRISPVPMEAGTGLLITAREVSRITEQKRGEEVLQEREERLRSVVESMSEGLMIFDARGNTIFQNPASLRIHGAEAGADGLFQRDALPSTWRGWDAQGLPLAFEEWPISRVLRGERFQDQVLRAECVPTGHQFHASFNGQPIHDEEGKLVYGFITIRDISEQVRARAEQGRAEAALDESEARFRLALHNAPVSVAAQDRELRYTWAYNQRTARPEQIVGHRDDEIFTPEEAARLTAIKRRVLDEGIEIHERMWIERPNGRMYLDICWEPIRDEGGRVTGVASATIDLTQTKVVEEALRESEARYRLLTEHAVSAVAVHEIVLDAEGRPVDYVFLSANPAFESHTGLRVADILGRRVTEVLPGIERTPLIEVYGKVAVSGEPVTFEQYFQPLDRHYLISAYQVSAGRFATAFTDITERKRMEEALRQAEERYRGFFDNLSEAVVVLEVVRDESGAVVDWRCIASNDAHQRLFGLARQDVLGALMSKVMGPAWVAKLNPRNGRVLATGEQEIDEFDLGGRRLGSTIFRIDSERVAISALDITERKRLDEALRQGEENLRTLIENVDVGVALIDEAGRFARFNRRFLTLFALAPDSTLANVNDTDWGRWHVVDAEERPLDVDDHPVRKVARTGQPVRNQLVGVRHPGERLLWMLVSAERMSTPGGVQTICTYQDVTAMRDAEEGLREADRRKSEFLAVLSHELRNPLAPIRNSVYVLDRVALDSAQAVRAKDVIRRQVDHLSRLVDDLLDVMRLSRGKIQIQRERIDLGEVVRMTMDDQRSLFERGGIELRVGSALGPAWIDADPTRVAQILGNLLQNALKFTPAGGVVTVSMVAAGGEVRLHVKDSGIGIAPAQVERMFEPFAQGDQDLARSRGGLGLGLYLAKSLAELHLGSVSARGEGLGHGAEFIVTLPLASHPAVPESASASTVPGPGRDVLVIEDNADAAESLADVLRLLGHRVRVAANGSAGLALARAQRPDVILCDIGLPDMNGYEVARAVRRDGALEGTRLVAVTGYAQPEDRERAIAAGFDGHVSKPPDVHKLVEVLGAGD